jgi:hypothetical protein
MDALVAPALGLVIAESALLALAVGVGPVAGADAVADGVGRAVVGVVGVVEAGVDELDARRTGEAVGEALADGDGAVPSRMGDGTGRGRVPAPAGPTGTTV